MIVSWNWLKDYVGLTMSPDELAHRLAMAGLNHESTTACGDDWAIDLEITSNRPDCLGHRGVAREIGVLWNLATQFPDPQPPVGATAVETLAKVQIECPELCPRYTARVVRGVKVGPSPRWLASRLETLGIAVISNVVDITNYVMMECGQPLHAFDLDRLRGRQIIVRSARANEPFTAIDHRTYTLQPGMCVIADAERAVALGGVMGGAETEVTSTTRDLLLEAADFDPLSIRTAARSLNLKSPSSYRFERGVDPEGIDWASRRACELILDLAGGELAAGVIDVTARATTSAPPVVLRLSQVERILGIAIDRDEIVRILSRLGLEPLAEKDGSLQWRSPSWRRDLSREIDLIEEIARIHGYDRIPEDVSVPMAPSHRHDRHRVLSSARQVLTACGFHEAMTASVVDEKTSACFSPWNQEEPIRSSLPMLRGANCLRRSLIPSLLESRRTNEARANEVIELFETAKVYFASHEDLPRERLMLSLTSGGDFRHVKGVIQAILDALHVTAKLVLEPSRWEFLESQEQGELRLGSDCLGLLGCVSQAGRKATDLRRPTVVAELFLDVLQQHARLVPQYEPFSEFPPITYDFNFIVDERVRWSELEQAARGAAQDLLEAIDYRETYRDPQRDGAHRKRLLLSVRLRSASQTLTGDQADAVRQAIIGACQSQLSATLL